jgi:para-aminobenzoate synthetase component 1
MTTAIQQKTSLPYFEDSSCLFAPIADKPWAVFLDSGYPYSDQGRYDIISYNPDVTLLTKGDTTEISEQGNISYSHEDPFLLVKGYLKNSFQPLKGIPLMVVHWVIFRTI